VVGQLAEVEDVEKEDKLEDTKEKNVGRKEEGERGRRIKRKEVKVKLSLCLTN
jgi:hypothetical protein